MILTLSCDESSHLLSDSSDRRLNRVERLALRLHLVTCRNCRRFRRQLQLFREAIDRLVDGTVPESPAAASLSPEARRRIEDALRRG
jgi:hypothetical protein